MNDMNPIGLRDSGFTTRGPRTTTGRKAAVALLAVLIVSVMVVWFAFLGWGAVEMLRSMIGGLGKLWTALF